MAKKKPPPAKSLPSAQIEPSPRLDPAAQALVDRIMSNPLMREAMNPPEMPPEIKRLSSDIVIVICVSRLLAQFIREGADLYRRIGPPERDYYPDRVEARREIEERLRQSDKAAARERGDQTESAPVSMVWSPWVRVLADIEHTYRRWCEVVHDAVQVVSDTAPWMDDGEARRVERWTVKCTADLTRLAGTLHPIKMGDDGRGLVRGGMDVPEEFIEMLVALNQRQLDLHSVDAARRAEAGQERWLTVTEVSEVFDMKPGRISRAVDDGKLVSNKKSGRQRRIDPASVVKFKLDAVKDRKIKGMRPFMR